MKKYKKITIILMVLSFIMLDTNTNSLACTIFTEYDNDLILVGNNEDWLYSFGSTYWIVPKSDDEYARICFGISTYVQGGMNEMGLFYDGATCPKSKIPYDSNKEQLGYDMGEIILSKCATVKEVLSFLENYNYPSDFSDHLMFVDQSGEAVVVEWLENEMVVIRSEENKLVSTNFYLSNQNLGGYPCTRYSKVEEMLNQKHSLNISYFADILRATTQDWGDGGTKYSNIYDLKALTVYIYEKSDFSRVAVINLKEELGRVDKDNKYNIQNINSLTYEAITYEEIKNDTKTKENIPDETKASDKGLSSRTQMFLLMGMIMFVIVFLICVFRKKRKAGLL